MFGEARVDNHYLHENAGGGFVRARDEQIGDRLDPVGVESGRVVTP